MPFRSLILLSCLCFTCGMVAPAVVFSQDLSNQDANLLADNAHKAKGDSNASGKTKKSKKESNKLTREEKRAIKEFARRVENAIHEADFAQRIQDAVLRGQYASALVYCEEAMASIDKKTDETMQYRIMAVCFELYDKNGKPQEALELSEKIRPLIKTQRERDAFCFSEATLLTKLHRWSEARAKYAECPGNKDEEKGVVESNVAELYMIEGDCENAVLTYRQSIAHNPDNPHAHFGMASALARLERWDESEAAFYAGIERDPEIRFLKSAFFEPACETDYQTSYLMYEQGRWKEAAFYMDRYISAELRQPYKDKALAFRNRIVSSRAPLEVSYPVLLDNVRTLAVEDNGEIFAFSVLARESAEEFTTQIWTLDVANEHAQMRLSLPGEVITDMAFLPGSQTLRMLGPKKRYEIDLSHPENGYLLYDNSEHIFALNLMPGGDDIVGVNVGGDLIASPWINPYLEIPIVEVPLETKRLRLTADHNNMVLTTTLKTRLVDIAQDYIQKEFTPLMNVNAIAVHPQKNLFALGIPSGVLLVDSQGTIRRMFGSQAGGVQALAFVGQGERLAVLTDHLLEIWCIE